MSIREVLSERIVDVIAVWDAHDPDIQEWTTPHTYACPDECGFRGTEGQWQQHLAEQFGAVLTVQTVDLWCRRRRRMHRSIWRQR